MTHALAIRFLNTLADMLDNERACSPENGTPSLCFSRDFALQFASACEHASEVLATLPEVEEEDE